MMWPPERPYRGRSGHAGYRRDVLPGQVLLRPDLPAFGGAGTVRAKK